MAYPTAYRSGSSQYGSAAGFQTGLAAANDNAPSRNPPRASNDNFPMPSGGGRAGSTGLSSGAVRAAAAVAGQIAGNTPLGRAAKAASALMRSAQGLAALSQASPIIAQSPWIVPLSGNGWTLWCGTIGPAYGGICGPYIEPQAVSCDLFGQASNPAGNCVPVNTMDANTNSYSVVWDYIAFAAVVRAYVFRYTRTVPHPDSTSDPAEVPKPRPAHKPAAVPAVSPGIIPPVQPIGAPLADPAPLPYTHRGLRNDEWHQVGPLPAQAAFPLQPPQFRQPPPKDTKERKFGAGAGAVVYRLASAITESADFIEAIWRAIPWQQRTNPKAKHLRGYDKPIYPGDPLYKVPGARFVHQTPQTMIKDIYNNFGDIDWDLARYNLVQEALVDAVVGGMVRQTKTNLRGYAPGFRGFWGPAM